MRRRASLSPLSDNEILKNIRDLQRAWNGLRIVAVGDFNSIKHMPSRSQSIDPEELYARRRLYFRPDPTDVEEAQANWSLANSLFEAISASDPDRVLRFYSDDATLENPITGLVIGADIGNVWRNFTAKTAELKIEFELRSGNSRQVKVDWTSEYKFFGTGRRVRHSGTTWVFFRSGQIIQQIDDFDLWHWSRQAFVPSGLFFGWTSEWRRWIQNEVREKLDIRCTLKP